MTDVVAAFDREIVELKSRLARAQSLRRAAMEERREKARELYQAGAPVKAIARRCVVRIETVHAWIVKGDWPRRRPAMSDKARLLWRARRQEAA